MKYVILLHFFCCPAYAHQTCWQNIATCGDPRCLVCTADRCKSISSNEPNTYDHTRDHLSYAGKYCSSGIAKSLCHHTIYIENTKTPEEESQVSQIFCRGIQHIHRAFVYKDPCQCPTAKDQYQSYQSTVRQSNSNCLAKSFSDPVRLFCTKILTAEHRCCR